MSVAAAAVALVRTIGYLISYDVKGLCWNLLAPDSRCSAQPPNLIPLATLNSAADNPCHRLG
jgi:hypothetical protein